MKKIVGKLWPLKLKTMGKLWPLKLKTIGKLWPLRFTQLEMTHLNMLESSSSRVSCLVKQVMSSADKYSDC